MKETRRVDQGAPREDNSQNWEKDTRKKPEKKNSLFIILHPPLFFQSPSYAFISDFHSHGSLLTGVLLASPRSSSPPIFLPTLLPRAKLQSPPPRYLELSKYKCYSLAFQSLMIHPELSFPCSVPLTPNKQPVHNLKLLLVALCKFVHLPALFMLPLHLQLYWVLGQPLTPAGALST